MEFAEKLITLRKSRELTQEQLAEQLNVQDNLFQNGKVGRSYPK